MESSKEKHLHGMMSLADLQDGKYLEGDSGEPWHLPDNFNMDKFHRGRRFFKDNLVCCTIAMFFSLILGMSIPKFLEALISTGESDSPKKSFKRYLYTYIHVLKWHYGNVWEKDSPSQKSVLFVKSLHEKVRCKMSEDLGQKERKYLSQYDMGIVLSGFMGPVILHPELGGLTCSRSDLDNYVYFWYGIGHLLGIQDKYNICADGLDQALKFCQEIEKEIVLKCLLDPPPEYTQMTGAVLQGVTNGRAMTLMTCPVISALFFKAIGQKYPGKLSTPDVIRFAIWKIIFFVFRHCSWIKRLLNWGVEKGHGLNFS